MSISRVPAALAVLVVSLGLHPAPVSGGGAALVEIRLFPDRASIFPGGAFAFGAIGHYADGTTRNLTRKVSFASAAPAVAAFEKKNVIRGVAAGATTITASASGVVSEPIAFEVSPIAALELSPDQDGIRLGSLVRFAADVTLANGAGGLDPDADVSWASDATDVIEIGTAKKERGLAEGLVLGTATLTASIPTPFTSASRDVSVVAALDSLRITPSSQVLRLGEGGRFRVLGSFEGGVEAEITLDVDWASTNEEVVTPTSKGGLKVRGLGETVLSVVDRATGKSSATSGGNATLRLVGELQTLTVTPDLLALAVGEETTLDVTASVETDESGSLGDFSWRGRVDWSSSDPSVASVDVRGDVRCEAPGTATLSARDRRSGVHSAESGGDAEISCS